jgi:hypothetical protein
MAVEYRLHRRRAAAAGGESGKSRGEREEGRGERGERKGERSGVGRGERGRATYGARNKANIQLLYLFLVMCCSGLVPLSVSCDESSQLTLRGTNSDVFYNRKTLCSTAAAPPRRPTAPPPPHRTTAPLFHRRSSSRSLSRSRSRGVINGSIKPRLKAIT